MKQAIVSSLSHVWLFFNPVDCSLPGCSGYGVSQARIVEWVDISFSRGSSQPRDQPASPALVSAFFTTEPPEKPMKQASDEKNLAWSPNYQCFLLPFCLSSHRHLSLSLF